MDISVGRLAEDDAEVFGEIRLEAFAARLERYPLMRRNVVILGTPYGTFLSFTVNCCRR